MKIAVFGSQQRAPEFCRFLGENGIRVVHFVDHSLLSWLDFLHHEDPQLFEQIASIHMPNWNEWNQLELESQNSQRLRFFRRFLHSDEEIEGKSRMHDLFRVVFESEASRIESGDSRKLEIFRDFDCVVDARSKWERADFCGAGGYLAMNEESFQSNIFRRWPSKEFIESLSEQTIVLQGDDWKIYSWVYALARFGTPKKVILVTRAEKPFQEIFKYDLPSHQAVLKFLSDQEEASAAVFEEFRQELFKKREQLRPHDDREPDKPWEMLRGYEISSFEYLKDRDLKLMTLERPTFRGEESVRVLSFDQLISSHSYGVIDWNQQLLQEPGFYRLSELSRFEDMIIDLEKYFSRVSS